MWRWTQKPEFQEAYRQARREALSRSSGRLLQGASAARTAPHNRSRDEAQCPQLGFVLNGIFGLASTKILNSPSGTKIRRQSFGQIVDAAGGGNHVVVHGKDQVQDLWIAHAASVAGQKERGASPSATFLWWIWSDAIIPAQKRQMKAAPGRTSILRPPIARSWDRPNEAELF